MRIFTHVSMDLDAVCSVWAARRFIPAHRAIVEFRPANWDGKDLAPDDLALDIEAGGRGLKGVQDSDGTVHSCFASLVVKYAPEEDQKALAPLIRFVDVQDAYGSAVKYFLPGASQEAMDVFSRTGLNAVLRAIQSACYNNDNTVLDRMSEILDGFLRSGRSRIRAATEADKAELFGGGLVALARNFREKATNGILFEERKVQMIVYVDGYNIGVLRHSDLKIRTDDPLLRAVVEKAGEMKEWFAHPAGFLFCRGSRKSPATSDSKVNPYHLAEAAVKLVSGR